MTLTWSPFLVCQRFASEIILDTVPVPTRELTAIIWFTSPGGSTPTLGRDSDSPLCILIPAFTAILLRRMSGEDQCFVRSYVPLPVQQIWEP
jgi:hypothetical protein